MSLCERRKLRVNVGKSKVMRCSRYGNGDRMHVILNGEPLEEVACNSLFPLPYYWYQILEIVYLYVWREERNRTMDMMRDTYSSS